MKEQFVSAREGAKILGVKYLDMLAFVRNSIIPATLIAGRYMVAQKDLEAYKRKEYGIEDNQ